MDALTLATPCVVDLKCAGFRRLVGLARTAVCLAMNVNVLIPAKIVVKVHAYWLDAPIGMIAVRDRLSAQVM